ncbi:YczI family protein [Oceanobacillus sp. M65]|uniref:YczI family protein n=1 Tax=Oceanobacillus sp. M65 TaxID=3457435 RepID=UPI003FCE9A52
MLKILRFIFVAVAIFFAVYGLTTGDFKFQPYMVFFVGLMMLVMGLEEFKKERKLYGVLLVIAFLFLLFVSLKGYY